jgi:transposase
MSKRIYNLEQIGLLVSNKNVSKCSDKSISFNKEFKLRAVKQYEEGMTSREIFRQANFDLNVIGKNTPKYCLRRWNKTYKVKGLVGLESEARGRGGGRPKTKGLAEKDKIKRLEAEVAYLKAENDFLAKLRAKRAE